MQRTRIALIALLATIAGIGTGCSTLSEVVTGECSGSTTAVVTDNSPTMTADAGFRLDQVAASVDAALERCDHLGLVTFASTPHEVDLDGVSTKVEGRNNTVRDRNRSHTVAQIVDRVDDQLTSSADTASGSDIVGALRFARTTYLDGDVDGGRVVLVTDGLASRPDLAVDQTVADPEGAVKALRDAGLDSLSLRGLTVELVGLGHSNEQAPLRRELVDALGDVWTQALARSGAKVIVREALADSAGRADAVRKAATSSTSEKVVAATGADAPRPVRSGSSGSPFDPTLIGAALLPLVRRRPDGGDENALNSTPFVPPTADPITANAVTVAGDPRVGSPTAGAYEAGAVDATARLQQAHEAHGLARRTARKVARLAKLAIGATFQEQRIVADLCRLVCADLDAWAARLVVGGRTNRHISRRTAALIEAGLVLLDVWALGNAVATGADLTLLDGLLAAGGGSLGMILLARLAGSMTSHHFEAARIPDDDPVRKFLPGVLEHYASLRPLQWAGGGIGLLLLVSAFFVGSARAEGAGWSIAGLMTILTAFTVLGTVAVEWSAANVVADQAEAAEREATRAAAKVKRSTGAFSSRELRAARKLGTQVTAAGEQTVASVAGHFARASAATQVRLGTHTMMPGYTAVDGVDVAHTELAASRLTAAEHRALPHEGVVLGADRVGAFMEGMSGYLDDRVRRIVETAAAQHREVLVRRLLAAGVPMEDIGVEAIEAVEAVEEETADTDTDTDNGNEVVDMTRMPLPDGDGDVEADDDGASVIELREESA